MGLFGRSKEEKEKAFVERAEELAGSLQAELYSSCKRALLARLPDDVAGRVAAAIANYVCRFGYINPEHESNHDLMRLFAPGKSQGHTRPRRYIQDTRDWRPHYPRGSMENRPEGFPVAPLILGK